MATPTPAQEEFNSLTSKASCVQAHHHPADIDDYRRDRETEEQDEDTQHIQKMINDSMKVPTYERHLSLPHQDFDRGRTTGVKGVIADARSYEEARRQGNRKTLALDHGTQISSLGEGEESEVEDEAFLQRWREQRREELENVTKTVKNRRTSPSSRRFGRVDDVDAMGYLDALEKVTPETVVVVFVYDPECPVTKVIADALTPLASAYPSIHFVRVHYADIEFDNAGVPAILGYNNQGSLFANLTYVVDYFPTDAIINTGALEKILEQHKVLVRHT